MVGEAFSPDFYAEPYQRPMQRCTQAAATVKVCILRDAKLALFDDTPSEQL